MPPSREYLPPPDARNAISTAGRCHLELRAMRAPATLGNRDAPAPTITSRSQAKRGS